MRLSELAAFEAAYQVLQPLDAASRRRALIWLTDALGETKPLAQSSAAAAESLATEQLQPSSGPGRRKTANSASNTPSTVKKARAAKRGRPAAVKKSSDGSRTYRRMPDAAEVLSAYRQAGSINALAEHFDVPVHTVYSWARRLRGQGHQIGR